MIFDLNGVLIVTRKGPTKNWSVILQPGLREFLSSCATKFTMYIWFSATRRNFSRHLEVTRERTSVHFKSSIIVDQALYFKNEHFIPEKPQKLILHKNPNTFFDVFLGTNYENTLLVDDTPYKNLFNPPFNAIFLEMFYESLIDNDYLFGIVFPYLEASHSSIMQVHKFVECNPFGRIRHVLPFDPWYEKLAESCFSKCNDIFCNMMKSKLTNKKR
jgi:hypothetical protein